MNKFSKMEYDYLEAPKLCAQDDFHGHVRRTINGEPISQEQLDIIGESINSNLKLEANDSLLDICCGNGALVNFCTVKVKYYLGVDFSPILIKIAKDNFEIPEQHIFIEDRAGNFARNHEKPEPFTKGLCYGSFSYLPPLEARQMLIDLQKRFVNISKLFIAPIPDIEKAKNFYSHPVEDIDLQDNHTAIGKWYSKNEFRELAESCGWNIKIIDKDPASYQAHCRFDALLSRS